MIGGKDKENRIGNFIRIGGNFMLTRFGKFCRKLRIDRGELLKDMAEKLGVTPSFLSAVETGIKNVPKDWFEKITKVYSLNEKEKEELYDAIQNSQLTVKFSLKELKPDEQDLVLAFARELKSLNDESKKRIQSILFQNKGG
jgi:transcriptional regulator with XRE-family HTH domain